MRKILATMLGATLAIAPAVAHADDPKRPLPDYDGRPSAPPTAGDVALWVPRVLLFPPYVVSEYVLRRPLGALIMLAERNDWATTFLDIFAFGPEHKGGIVPTAFYDFGFQPSVGLYFFWDDLFVKKNDFRAHVSYFGASWVAGAVSDRLHVGAKSVLSLNASWVRRPDFVYAGEGARTTESMRSRYFADITDTYADFKVYAVRAARFEGRFGVRNAGFSDRGFQDDPSVLESVRANAFAVPTAYDRGYTAVYERGALIVDSRAHARESGIRASAYVENGTDVSQHVAASWVKYGGSLGGSLNVWNGRTLSLSVMADFADPLRGGNIPFTEEVVWGGKEPLSGDLPGRFHGRSATAVTLGYSWPIWVWLDGTMHASLGNVFDAGLRDFSPGLLRLSSGVGIQSTGDPDHRFEILVGFATETFDQGGKVDSFRLVVGGTNGF